MKVLLTNCRKFLIVLGALLLCAGIVQSCAAQKNPKKPAVNLPVGAVVFKTEIAKTPLEQQMGLMYREQVADDEAMLFVYDKEEAMHFWMKNTLVDLSIAFIAADGTIREIHEMQAGNLQTVSSNRPAQYALEVAKGAFARRGVKVGDKVDLRVLQKSP